jgi:asparagine synthase (glutamine-hydrolysing)
MCGIAGIIDFESKADNRLATGLMLKSISHRGPDESGVYHSKYASLGNVRLSIIDIQGGQQPLSDTTSRYWITFNGEIFNYRELRKDLENKGHRFRTQSDTEVLVNLYSVYGHKCLDMLNGQFAFAIWDKKEEQLFIARDRMGIRPFFYNIHNGVFSFASELKALFVRKDIPREFNNEGLSQVFTFWTSVTPVTAFRGIYELSPGYYGYYNRNGLKTHQYWNLNFSLSQNPISLTDAIDQFNELLTESVRIRLRADVEVGAYLSGGIDSSATVAYIKDIEPGVLNTFSIGFRDKDFDESYYQEEAVKYFNTRHQPYVCTSEEIAEAFPSVIWHSEIPLTRTAPTPMYLLSRLVRQNNIKVVVTGEGSDEFLAGYDIFKEAMIRRFWASQPDSEMRPMLFRRLYRYIPQIAGAGITTIRLFFRYMLEDVNNPFYSHLIRWNNSNHIKKHFSEGMKESIQSYSPVNFLYDRLPSGFNSWDPLAKAQWLEATIFMSGYLLSSQGDRMSMANSVEGRYPFLDYRLIEFCNSLPPTLKLRGLTEKFLLKKLLKNRIPQDIIARPKQPYRAPVSNVFLTGKTPDYVMEMLTERQTSKVNVFDYKTVNSVISRIKKTGISSEVDDMLITSVISTHLLYNQYIEGNNHSFTTGKLSNFRITEDLPDNETIIAEKTLNQTI